MECGWDTNTIAPDRQGQDWSVADDGISTPEECHQACLTRSACKAYRWDAKQGLPCEIFNVAIGPGGANLISPTARGSQWWDRNCAAHLPSGCKKSSATGSPSKSKRIPRAAVPAPAHPLITAAPLPVPELLARKPALAKRDTPLPPYMEDLSYYWSSVYLTPACSCIISSAAAPVPSNTTTTYTKYTATEVRLRCKLDSMVTNSLQYTTTTFVDPFTVTVTPRQTTVYPSIN